MVHAVVTGAAGFLGFHIARALARRPDHRVTIIDNFVRGEKDPHYAALSALPNVTAIETDLCDAAAVAALPLDVDFVYHMAALNGTQNFYERPLEVIKCCTLPTLFLADHYKAVKAMSRFVYAGTSEAYASTVTRFNWPVPTAEDVPLGIDDVSNPRWSYGASKMHGEVVTLQTGLSTGLPVTVIRFHNAYGPRMGDKHVVPDFYERMKSGRYELFGHEDTRSFIYVDDAVRATIMAAEAPGAIGQVVNVGSQREITIRALAEEMLRERGVDAPIVLHPSPKGSVKRRAPDISKLKGLTGFEEKIDLTRGLGATADFYLNGRLADAIDPDAVYQV